MIKDLVLGNIFIFEGELWKVIEINHHFAALNNDGKLHMIDAFQSLNKTKVTLIKR